jgi:DNA polymerase-3 subunit epsilon
MTCRSSFWADRETAQVWARWLLAHDNLVVLDTETTGLGDTAEAVSVAAIDRAGCILLDAQVRPVYPVPREAMRIHGITNAGLIHAQTFVDLYPRLRWVFGEFHVVIFNAAFDERAINQCCALHDLPPLKGPAWNCVMEGFAAYWGDWSEYWGNYKWKSLEFAAGYAGYEQEKAHDALDDCRATLAVLKCMAEGR